MNDALTQVFIQLIATRIGLQIRPQDRAVVSQKILKRMKAIQLADPEKYYQILAAPTRESQSEWRELVLLLTTNETYFMRDKGQLGLLENTILPELIEQKIKLRKALGIQPTLRLWSAGCSTGEEPYSLIIILNKLISDWAEWKILVLGTDINEAAIEKAKRGVYSPWSFRLVEPEVQSRYFKQRQNEWEIDFKLRESVNFNLVNLVNDNFPNIYKDIYNMDLIVCRNVFVYFEAKYTSIVLKKFAKTLRPGGYLMTGHAEVHGQITSEFKAKVFPESVVYQRCDARKNECCKIAEGVAVGEANLEFEEAIKPAVGGTDRLLPERIVPTIVQGGNSGEMTPILTASTPLGKMLRARYVEGDSLRDSCASRALAASVSPRSTPEQEPQKMVGALILEAKTCFKNQAYSEAIAKAKQSIALHSHNFEAYYLLAQIYANLGQYAGAIEYCKRASEVDSMSVFPYFLQAHIAEEKGDLETAKMFLKRIIYLCPSFISAYLELGNIYRKEGQLERAIKMYNSSCEILNKLPPNTPIEQQGKMTAIQVLMDVKRILLKLDSK